MRHNPLTALMPQCACGQQFVVDAEQMEPLHIYPIVDVNWENGEESLVYGDVPNRIEQTEYTVSCPPCGLALRDIVSGDDFHDAIDACERIATALQMAGQQTS